MFIPLAFLSRNYWDELNYHLMANISEKSQINFVENLNLGLSYLIITVCIAVSPFILIHSMQTFTEFFLVILTIADLLK